MSRLDVPGYFTQITGLGRLVDYFPMQHLKLNRWGSMLLGIVALGAAAVILAIGLVETYDRYYKNGPAVILKTIALPGGGALLLIIIGILALLASYRSRNKGAALYEGGIAYSDLKGIRAWRWDDITGMQVDIVRRRISEQIDSIHHTYLLTNQKGERIVLDESLTRIEQLGSAIRDRVTPRLLSRYSAAYNGGQPVHFGPVSLAKTSGLRVGKHEIPWDRFREATIQQGLLRLNASDGEVISLEASEIPNLEVMLSLLDQKPI